MKQQFIEAYRKLYKCTKKKAETIFLSAIFCGDEDYIKEIIRDYNKVKEGENK